jgi:hypothetical protein
MDRQCILTAPRVLEGIESHRPAVGIYHLYRTRLELIVERKIRRRQLTDDGNIEITGRDLRERNAPSSATPDRQQFAPRFSKSAGSGTALDRASGDLYPLDSNPEHRPNWRVDQAEENDGTDRTMPLRLTPSNRHG